MTLPSTPIIKPLPSEKSLPPSVEDVRGEGVRGVQPVGMLPIAKSTGGVVSIIFGDWDLPGHGHVYPECGIFGMKGCLNVAGHGYRLDVGTKYVGKVYIKGFKRSCDRAECPVCFEKWASRAGVRAERRLKLYKGGYRRPIHLSVSPKREDCGIPYSKLKSKARRILLSVGVEGGLLIFHPWRKDARGWYESPHFHVVGYGWIRGKDEFVKRVNRIGRRYLKRLEGTAGVYERTGWVVHNIGVRKTVRGTISYQLSHAGIHPEHHTITWFGSLSYNKFKVKIKEPDEVCPLCEEKLIMLKWIGGVDRPPPPKVEAEYFDDPEGWRPKIMKWSD